MPTVKAHWDPIDAALGYRMDGLALRAGHAPSTVAGLFNAARSGDQGVIERVLAASLTVDDRRQLTSNPIGDRAAMVSSLTAYGVNAIQVTMLAVRGSSLAMFRIKIARTEGGIADLLAVERCTAADQVDLMVLHDTRDLDGALRTLSELYSAELVAPQRLVYETVETLAASLLRRDYDTVEALLAPELRSVDHLDGDLFVFDRAETSASLRVTQESVPGQLSYITDVHGISDHGLVVSRTWSTPETLGLTEPELVVVGVRDGYVNVLDHYDVADLGRAFDRLDELAGR